MYMTQEMLVDPSRESFILIGVAIFLVGFINGAINTAGLAAVIATGGTSAYAIEAINGFVGGFLWNTVNQLISYDDYNPGKNFINSRISVAFNLI